MAFGDRLRSFFRGIGDAISDLFAGPSEEQEQEQERQRERPRGYGPDYFPPIHEERMHDIWTEVTGESWSFSDASQWEELFLDTGIQLVEDNPREIEAYWNAFLRSHYLTSGEAGSISRDNYYNDSGLGSDRIDWTDFREIKRGTP